MKDDDYQLLNQCKLAVLEADSELSAFAAGRPLDKATAEHVYGMCREAYKAIVARMLQKDDGAQSDLLTAAKQAEAVMAKNVYPQPDKPDSAWGVLCRLREAVAKYEGRES